DHGGGGGDAHRQHLLSEERVHEGGLSVVELAHHHQVEAVFPELADDLAGDAPGERLGPHRDGVAVERLERGDDLVAARVEDVEDAHQPTPLVMPWTCWSASSIEMPPERPRCSR